MTRFFVPTSGPWDWKALLADPSKHWRRGKSAYEMAVAWETERRNARGIPTSAAAALDSCPDLRGASLLLGIPEHQVSLEGGGHPSQTDLWALLDAPVGVVSAAIEAKAGEGFDDTVEEWLSDATDGSGKPRRLRQLEELLQIDCRATPGLRYQLLHRAASAILEARRLRLRAALMLVQSFASDPEAQRDFAAFAGTLGASLAGDGIAETGKKNDIRFWVGWVSTPLS